MFYIRKTVDSLGYYTKRMFFSLHEARENLQPYTVQEADLIQEDLLAWERYKSTNLPIYIHHIGGQKTEIDNYCQVLFLREIRSIAIPGRDNNNTIRNYADLQVESRVTATNTLLSLIRLGVVNINLALQIFSKIWLVKLNDVAFENFNNGRGTSYMNYRDSIIKYLNYLIDEILECNEVIYSYNMPLECLELFKNNIHMKEDMLDINLHCHEHLLFKITEDRIRRLLRASSHTLPLITIISYFINQERSVHWQMKLTTYRDTGLISGELREFLHCSDNKELIANKIEIESFFNNILRIGSNFSELVSNSHLPSQVTEAVLSCVATYPFNFDNYKTELIHMVELNIFENQRKPNCYQLYHINNSMCQYIISQLQDNRIDPEYLQPVVIFLKSEFLKINISNLTQWKNTYFILQVINTWCHENLHIRFPLTIETVPYDNRVMNSWYTPVVEKLAANAIFYGFTLPYIMQHFKDCYDEKTLLLIPKLPSAIRFQVLTSILMLFAIHNDIHIRFKHIITCFLPNTFVQNLDQSFWQRYRPEPNIFHNKNIQEKFIAVVRHNNILNYADITEEVNSEVVLR